MQRPFPLSRGSHPQPPLYPGKAGGSAQEMVGELTGVVSLDTPTATQTPLSILVNDSNPRGSVVTVTLTAAGCEFSDTTTSKVLSLDSGSTSPLAVTVNRPLGGAGQGRVTITFTAYQRLSDMQAVDIAPQITPVPAPGPAGSVLASDGASFVNSRDLTLDSISVSGDAAVGAFGCNGATVQGPVTLAANATDLATALTLLNQVKALLIANGQGA